MMLFVGVLLAVAGLAGAAEQAPLLVHAPTLNRTQVVFVYGGYLWSVPREGGEARQLTTGGHEGLPAFSPDGKWIAFSGEYDGNIDAYVMPAEGGEPRRLTWHPAPDVVTGWTPDSKRVMFYSSREAYADFDRLYTVGVEGGWPEVLPMWRAEDGWFSPDAKRIAYVPNLKWQTSWKRYKGGQTTPIYIAQLSDLHVGSFDPKQRALQWAALSNSLNPDLAVVTGDLVTGGTGFYADVADAIAALRAKDGVFVSMGNHDQAHNDELSRLVEARGPTVLRNTAHILHRGDAQLVVAGLDGRIASSADAAKVVRSCSTGAPLVLLSHYPWTFPAVAAAGADLVLTGHTHGGQLAIPFFSQRFNLARLTRQLSRGLYYSGKTAMYVNAGLGTTGPPMRLAVPPEIALVTLRRG